MSVSVTSTLCAVLKHYNACCMKSWKVIFLSGFSHTSRLISNVKHYFFLKNRRTGTPVKLKCCRS
jgi:hypothetical protein